MMKNKTLRTLTLIFILILTFCAAFGASAESENVYERNNALLSERYSSLLEMKAENSATEAGRSVNNFIDKYASLMNNISPERLADESAEELIELYYAQGEIAGRVAWVYYTYIGELDEEARAAVEKVHTGVHSEIEDVDGVQDEIAKATNADDLRESELLSYNNGGLLARVYVAIYTERLDALILPEDTELVREIVWGENGAVAAIKQSKVVTTAEYYDQVYAKAAADIIVRRNKDIAISEIIEAYGIIFPDGNYKTDVSVTEAIDAINADIVSQTTQMNKAVEGAVAALFDALCEQNGDFVKAYIDGMRLSVTDEVKKADLDGKVVDLSVAFGEYKLHFARAEAKDIINEDISGLGFAEDDIMKALADEYCADGGVIDECGDVRKVKNELLKARKRILLYEEYKKSISAIIGFVGEGELTLAAEKSYVSSDAVLSAVDNDAEGYDAELEKKFSDGCDALADIVTDAEVKNYEPKHTYIINKDIKEINLTDKDAIIAAIEDMDALGEGAQGVFEEREIPDPLAEKYKKIARLEVEHALGQTEGQRKSTVDKLCLQIEALTVSGRANALAELKDNADGIVLKARESDAIVSRYDEIVASADYQSFAETDKKTLSTITDGALAAIVDIKSGEELAATVKKISYDGIVALNRAEGCARVDACAASRSDIKDTEAAEAVRSIAAEAKQNIGGVSEAEEIEKIADKAIFDISKEFDLCDMNAKVADAKATVEALDVLDEEQKGEFVSQIEAILVAQSDILKEAKNDAVRLAAKRDFETKMATLIEDSKRENEAQRIAKRVEYSELLRADHKEALSAAGGLSFLNPAERKEYISRLDAVLESGLADIENAMIQSQMEEARGLSREDMDKIIAEGRSDDEKAGGERKAISNGDLRVHGNGIINKIKSLQYLSDEEKLAAEQGVIAVLDNYSDSLDVFTSAHKLAESEAAAYGVINNICRECEMRDLSEARSAAILAMNERKNKVVERIGRFDFLDDSVKETLKTEPEALLSYAREAIKECEGVDDVHALRDDVIGKLNSCESIAKNRENEACVKALTPVMIALAIAFGVLGIAAVILALAVKKKRGIVFARCAIPVTLLAIMMPSALAWVITVLLALIDLALVALIVYLVIRLIDKKMFDRYDGYDDYLEPEEEQYEYGADGEDGATEAFDEGSDNEKCVEKESPDEISDEASDEVEGFCEDVTEEETVAFGENRVGGAVAVLAERKKAPALAERKKAPALKAAPAFARLFAPAAKLRIAPGPQLIYLMPPAVPEMLESVTVEEADRMMTDEEAFSYEKTDIISTEVYSGNKKAIVNVDAIGRAFEAGDVVSINTLKEKKLISQNVGWIKVLGKGVLDKPLTVIAQNYSASAVKMIVLTGGTAILAEGSPERRK